MIEWPSAFYQLANHLGSNSTKLLRIAKERQMPTWFSIERDHGRWIVLADGHKVLSFDNEAAAIAAVNDANVLLLNEVGRIREGSRGATHPRRMRDRL